MGKKFDASGYTKAILDVGYKNQTEKYVELTGADKKDADKIFEDNLNLMLQEFAGYELPDELEEKYRVLFQDMMKKGKYTVAVKPKRMTTRTLQWMSQWNPC